MTPAAKNIIVLANFEVMVRSYLAVDRTQLDMRGLESVPLATT